MIYKQITTIGILRPAGQICVYIVHCDEGPTGVLHLSYMVPWMDGPSVRVIMIALQQSMNNREKRLYKQLEFAIVVISTAQSVLI